MKPIRGMKMMNGVMKMKIKNTVVLRYIYNGEHIECTGSFENVRDFFNETTAIEHYNDGDIEDIEVSYASDYVPTCVGFDEVQDFFDGVM